MHSHHAESIENMIVHYRADKEIKALFLIGSIATGTERPDSDIDGVAVISDDYYQQKQNENRLEEVYHGQCTYEGGYFNIHYTTQTHMAELVKTGSEPMRNMFSCARPLFSDEPELCTLAAAIPRYPKEEAAAKQLKFYCTLKMFYTYFWKICKPEGFMRLHVADGMIYNLYRLILIENEILFPSMRKLEEYVSRAHKKPDGIVAACHTFIKTLADKDCLALVEHYEAWTTYDYPKDPSVIMNNFSDPYEWH